MQKSHVLGTVNQESQPERLCPQLQNGSIFCPGQAWLTLSQPQYSAPHQWHTHHSHLAFHPPFHGTFLMGTGSLVPEMLQPLCSPTSQ